MAVTARKDAFITQISFPLSVFSDALVTNKRIRNSLQCYLLLRFDSINPSWGLYNVKDPVMVELSELVSL